MSAHPLPLPEHLPTESECKSGIFHTDGFAVEARGASADLGGTGDEDFVCGEQLAEREGALRDRDVETFRGSEQMSAGDPTEDSAVERMREQDAVLQYRDIGMGTFRHGGAAVEHRLVGARHGGAL